MDVSLDAGGCPAFMLVSGSDRGAGRLAVPGEHMVSNALAAAAVGLELGVPLTRAAEALGGRTSPGGAWNPSRRPSGVRVLNDAYNANPESMAAALKTARWMAGDAQCIAVLGTMAELGPIADREHERVGELAARVRIDRVVVVGRDASLIATAAEREGVEPENVASYRTSTARWPTCWLTRTPAIWSCARPPGSQAWIAWRRPSVEVDPGCRRRGARRHAVGDPHRDPRLPRVGVGAAHP